MVIVFVCVDGGGRVGDGKRQKRAKVGGDEKYCCVRQTEFFNKQTNTSASGCRDTEFLEVWSGEHLNSSLPLF